MPPITNNEPIQFISVIGSLKRKKEMSNTNKSVSPLNMYAIESGMREIICCQMTANTPITKTAPIIQNKYAFDIIG